MTTTTTTTCPGSGVMKEMGGFEIVTGKSICPFCEQVTPIRGTGLRYHYTFASHAEPCTAEVCHDASHTSLDCYAKYVEAEYEGGAGGALMTPAEWKRSTEGPKVVLVHEHRHDDLTTIYLLTVDGKPATLVVTPNGDSLVYDDHAVDLICEANGGDHELARAVYEAVDPDAR